MKILIDMNLSNGGYNSLRMATPSCLGLEEANELPKNLPSFLV
jgi:hypothetical protein